MGIQQSTLKKIVVCGKEPIKKKSSDKNFFTDEEEEEEKRTLSGNKKKQKFNFWEDNESEKQNSLSSNKDKFIKTVLLRDSSKVDKKRRRKKKKRRREKEREDVYFTKLQAEYYKKMYENEGRSRKKRDSFNDDEEIKWREGHILGSGSFGTVLWGFNETKGNQMAVKKVYLGESCDVADKVAALEQEIKLLKKLNHTNIVKYYGSQRSKDSLNIFLEYVENGSLLSVIQKYTPLSEKLIKLYTKQILRGLEYLHSHNLIHRDIKAANVLVDRKGVCKLSDFGTAKMIFGMDEKLNSLKGTVNWMAPEVIKQSGYGRYADIWSVGCTVYEMLTGGPPWSNVPSMYEVMSIVVSGEELPELPDDISYECRDFIECCLRRKPSERLNVYELLQHPFLEDKGEDDFYLQMEIEKDMLQRAKKKQKKRDSVDFRNYLAILRKDGGKELYTKKETKKLSKLKKDKKRPKIRLKIPKVQDDFESDNEISFDDDDDDDYDEDLSASKSKSRFKLRLNSSNQELLVVLKDKSPSLRKKSSKRRKKNSGSRGSMKGNNIRKFKKPTVGEGNLSTESLNTGLKLSRHFSTRSSKIPLSPTKLKGMERRAKNRRKKKKKRKREKKIAVHYKDEDSNFFLEIEDDCVICEEEPHGSLDSINMTRKSKEIRGEQFEQDEDDAELYDEQDSSSLFNSNATPKLDKNKTKKSSDKTVGNTSFKSTPIKSSNLDNDNEEFYSENTISAKKRILETQMLEDVCPSVRRRVNSGVQTADKTKKKYQFFQKNYHSKESNLQLEDD